MSLLLLLNQSDCSTYIPPLPGVGGGEPLAYLPVKYGEAVTILFEQIKAASTDYALAHEWTPQWCDTHISKDGACDVYITTAPSAVSGGCGLWQQPLSSCETMAKFISVRIRDAAPKQVEDNALHFFTYGNPNAYWPEFAPAAPAKANVTLWADTAVATPDTAGYPKVTLKTGCGTGEVALNSGGVPLAAITHTGAVIPLVTDVTTKTGYSLSNPAGMKKNAAATLKFEMRDATTGLLKSGVTVNATRSIDNGDYAACANSVVEIQTTGTYRLAVDPADNNGDSIMFLFTGTGCRETTVFVLTEP